MKMEKRSDEREREREREGGRGDVHNDWRMKINSFKAAFYNYPSS
jgi:hypothetical protein